jgi:Fe-S oxidoreductase
MDYSEISRVCFRCGYCKLSTDYSEFNCPSYVQFGFDTYAPGGRNWLINAWHDKEIDITPNFHKILYSCVTCGNCKEHCALECADELLNIFEDAKSELVAEGMVPPEVRDYFKAISINGNPYKESQADRGKWANETGIEPYSNQEYLYYVGDVGSFDERGNKVARSVASLLTKAGISMGILGEEELSDGNDVKALGEKWLFESLAKENIKTFKKHGVKKIITLDPHAFNAFTTEYPELGISYKAYHYTQIILKLIKEGKLEFSQTELKITYHDPCYLGRHNKIYDIPREILTSVPGLGLREMVRCRENALCCGGGGGNFFTDIIGGGEDSPSRLRVRDALQTGSKILAVACPLCCKMLDDAVKAESAEKELLVRDISEILNEAVI